MTAYEAACQFFGAYDRWRDLSNWFDWHVIGRRDELTGLATKPKTEDEAKELVRENARRTKAVLGNEFNDEYVTLLEATNKLNKKLNKDYRDRRKEMDRTHVIALDHLFPKDRKGRHTVYDKGTHMDITFTVEECRYLAGSSFGHTPRKPGDTIFTTLDFVSEEIGRKHARIYIDKDSKITFDSSDDIY